MNLEKMTREELGDEVARCQYLSNPLAGIDLARESLRRLSGCEAKCGRLRSMIRAEHMPEGYDVPDDATTELAVELAECEVERAKWEKRHDECEKDVEEIATENDRLEAKLATAIADRGVLVVKLWKAENPELVPCACGALSALLKTPGGWHPICIQGCRDRREEDFYFSTIPLAVEAWKEKNDGTVEIQSTT